MLFKSFEIAEEIDLSIYKGIRHLGVQKLNSGENNFILNDQTVKLNNVGRWEIAFDNLEFLKRLKLGTGQICYIEYESENKK